MTDRPGSQWTPWRECCDTTRAMHSHEVGRFNRFGIMREIRPVFASAADPGEVERLRAEVKRLELMVSQSDYSYDMDRDHMKGRINSLEDLIRKFGRNCKKHQLHHSDQPALSGVRWYLKRFEAALSASAEPSALVERDERAEFEACIRSEWPMAPISRKRDLLPKNDPCYGDYCDEPLQRAWVGWQMRAALERKPS